MSTFTQKHYEHVEREFRAARYKLTPQAFDVMVEIMIVIFTMDNPKFKPDVFRSETARSDEQ